MMTIFMRRFLSLLLLADMITTIASRNTGRVAIWSNDKIEVTDSLSCSKNGLWSTPYRTKTTEVADISRYLQDCAPFYHTVIYFTYASSTSETTKSILETKFFQESYIQSPLQSRKAISSVYFDDVSISENLFSSKSSSHIEQLSVKDLLDKLTTDSSDYPRVYHVTLKSTVDPTELLNTLKSITNSIMYVAIEDNISSPMPEQYGHYHRILEDGGSNIYGSVYYEPEGTEFSIYWADTYLYITPEIFAGLLTGLFFFFVVMIGLTCMGSLRGIEYFADKAPSVGREA